MHHSAIGTTRKATDAQVIEVRAERIEGRLHIAIRILGRQPENDAIAGDHVQNVDAFDANGGRGSIRFVLFAISPEHMRFGSAKRNNSAMTEIFNARGGMAAI